MANQAAWISGPKAKPFEVKEAPMPTLKDDEVLIRNHAVAINPVDWAVQNMGILIQHYPYITGTDAAGQITAIGSAVTKFKVGDRVTAIVGSYEVVDGKHDLRKAAFQIFIAINEHCAAKIPDNVSYAEASVLPLAISTAASGLFEKRSLGLTSLPSINAKPTGSVVLIWGGGSSVGATAIQVAVGAGYEVATTASAAHLEYMKSLRAKYVFDRSKETVVEDIIAALKGKEFAGAFCAGSFERPPILQCAEVAHALGGKQLVATVKAPNFPMEVDLPGDVKNVPTWGSGILEFEPSVWDEWIPAALANGDLKCAPPPLVVGEGLEAIQGAIDRWREGVSCEKVVVEIP